MGHVLRMIGIFLGKYRRYFENLRIALWAKIADDAFAFDNAFTFDNTDGAFAFDNALA